ncbi:MAG: helix-turn-helix transcriptional regulator [Brevundimonas sp.]|uniref:helix-turn-helix domain-containing protein n=1 Tax=Brevundimonas sp. TaxID=1871086 RepID=UPI00391AFDD0
MSVVPASHINERLNRLTRQERRCLEGVADHLQASQIADRLGLATATVESHLAQARRKLGVTSSRAAVQLIRQAGHLHTGYGGGFSRIVIDAGDVTSEEPKGTADAADQNSRDASPMEMGGSPVAPGGGVQYSAPPGGRPTHDAGDPHFGVGASAARSAEGDTRLGRLGPQSGLFKISRIPPRGLVPRIGLTLITALLLVVILAVLVSVHTLLQ